MTLPLLLRLTNNSNWYCYGQNLYAVADGVVVKAMDGIPDNVPLATKRAAPITLDTICGNFVLIDIGAGSYALYAHMIPDSVRVNVGDKVRAGQVIGLLGNSGNSDAPHLHFHISTTPNKLILASEGLPYEIDSFEVEGKRLFLLGDLDDIRKLTFKPKRGEKPKKLHNEMPIRYYVYSFPM